MGKPQDIQKHKPPRCQDNGKTQIKKNPDEEIKKTSETRNVPYLTSPAAETQKATLLEPSR